MRLGNVLRTAVMMTALASACAHKTGETNGEVATGGAPGSGGSTSNTGGSSAGSGGVVASSGGVTGSGEGGAGTGGAGSGGAGMGTGGVSSGSGGSGTGGAMSPGDASGSDQASAPPMMGGKALLVVGTIPIVGTDVQFEAAFKARGMEVEIVQESAATPMHAQGKRVIMLSYSMSSTAFKAEAFTDVPVPIIVTEQNLLPRIKMSTGHGFTPSNLTKISVISDHELAGGFPKGEVVVYMRQQEMFWGTPPESAIKIAHITGAPEKITYFAYEKGAMMAGAMAPAKRVQFFHATHSPDPVDKNLYLNENGLKLLGVTIDWCLKE